MVGSFIPLARTKSEREAAHDPRPSIEERYANREDFLNKVDAAAKPLVSQHLLLDRDVPKVKEKASARWDAVAK